MNFIGIIEIIITVKFIITIFIDCLSCVISKYGFLKICFNSLSVFTYKEELLLINKITINYRINLWSFTFYNYLRFYCLYKFVFTGNNQQVKKQYLLSSILPQNKFHFVFPISNSFFSTQRKTKVI